MRILSEHDAGWCDFRLGRAQSDLQACIKAMKGKYGTRRAVSRLNFCLNYLYNLVTNSKYKRNFY